MWEVVSGKYEALLDGPSIFGGISRPRAMAFTAGLWLTCCEISAPC